MTPEASHNVYIGYVVYFDLHCCIRYCLRFVDTVLQPKIKKKKSVSKLEVKDTKEASKYMLTHQDMDSDDNLTTKIYKVS